jgi:hypothetical protein
MWEHPGCPADSSWTGADRNGNGFLGKVADAAENLVAAFDYSLCGARGAYVLQRRLVVVGTTGWGDPRERAGKGDWDPPVGRSELSKYYRTLRQREELV